MAMKERTGGSLLSMTVTVKLRVIEWLVGPPSSMVTVRVAVPLALGREAKLRVPVVCG